MADPAKHRAAKYFGPKDEHLLFHRLTGSECLGRPYEYQLDLLSERGGVLPSDLLGEAAGVEYTGRDRYQRYFHGFITTVEVMGFEGRYHRYRLTLKPWLSLLGHMADCRIFQEQSVVEIVEAVFQEHGFSNFELALSDAHDSREYCVQYQETSLDFINRLMEEGGIYYYFRHEKSKHVLVLADDPSGHSADSKHAKLPFHPPESADQVREDHVSRLTASGEITSGPFELTSYDFVAPRKDLLVSAEVSYEPSLSDYKVFDWSGRYTEGQLGQQLVRVRAEAEGARRDVYHGESDAPAIAVGNLLSIGGHPEERFNREYLVTSVHHEVTGDDYQGDAGGESFRCRFTLIPSNVVYRSLQTAPKPVARGLQTAMVVGKSGEEIWTDEHGRVKVQFHWDRYGKKDENSSCWVRVAQVHAGSSWGAIDLPRIGEEVIVAFEHGDPDRPVIIGSLYNGQAKPPYPLPGEQTRSGMKSNSSKGGGGFNELRFDDKTGEEEVYLRAEKDFNALIQNDRSLEIGNNQLHKVGKDDSVEIGDNQTTKIGKKLDIDAGDQITLKTGQSKIVMKKNGDIEISGINIQVKGKKDIKLKSNLNLKAEGTLVEIKGSAKLSLKAALVDLGAQAMAKLKGAITMIG